MYVCIWMSMFVNKQRVVRKSRQMSYWDKMMRNGKNQEDIAGNKQELQGHYSHIHTAAFHFITLILLMRITSSRQEKNLETNQQTSARS